MAAEMVALRFLVITSFEDEEDIALHKAEAPHQHFPLRLTSLLSLEINNTHPKSTAAILDGIGGENLLSLRLSGRTDEGSETHILHRLIRPRADVSILSSLISRLGVALLTVKIKDDCDLEIIGRAKDQEDSQRNSIHIQLYHEGWSRCLNAMDEFAVFSRSLPPVKFCLHGLNYSNNPIILRFLLSMPTVTSIEIRSSNNNISLLFQDILSHSHSAGYDVVWACPNLTEVRIALLGDVGNWDHVEALVRTSLRTREEAWGAEGLPRISVWMEVDREAGTEWLNVV